jgi:hypothetical protein
MALHTGKPVGQFTNHPVHKKCRARVSFFVGPSDALAKQRFVGDADDHLAF